MAKKILLILVLLAVGTLCWLYWPAPPSYIPEHLRGVWKTDHPRYADRYLDISEAIFTIGQGDQRLEVLFVRQVERKTVGALEQYTLHYADAERARGALATFSFLTESTEDGLRLQLINQRDIAWFRETAPPAAPQEADRP